MVVAVVLVVHSVLAYKKNRYHFDTNGLVTARFYRDSRVSQTDSVMVCLGAWMSACVRACVRA